MKQSLDAMRIQAPMTNTKKNKNATHTTDKNKNQKNSKSTKNSGLQKPVTKSVHHTSHTLFKRKTNKKSNTKKGKFHQRWIFSAWLIVSSVIIFIGTYLSFYFYEVHNSFDISLLLIYIRDIPWIVLLIGMIVILVKSWKIEEGIAVMPEGKVSFRVYVLFCLSVLSICHCILELFQATHLFRNTIKLHCYSQYSVFFGFFGVGYF